MTALEGITVNGIQITTDQINEEMQYHPASSMLEARYEAMKALVIRELLLQRAASLGLTAQIKQPDLLIDEMLAQEIQVPEPDHDTCYRYYQNNKHRFYTSPLFEVAHILYLAPPEDAEKFASAKTRAEQALQKILAKPALFEQLAREESACSSATSGGHIGQISKGQTLPAFEAALFKMQENELSKEPVATEVGYHIIRVLKKVDGQQLEYTAVENWIRDLLTSKSWETAFNQYVQLLAGRAAISGFTLPQADSPLVQ